MLRLCSLTMLSTVKSLRTLVHCKQCHGWISAIAKTPPSVAGPEPTHLLPWCAYTHRRSLPKSRGYRHGRRNQSENKKTIMLNPRITAICKEPANILELRKREIGRGHASEQPFLCTFCMVHTFYHLLNNLKIHQPHHLWLRANRGLPVSSLAISFRPKTVLPSLCMVRMLWSMGQGFPVSQSLRRRESPCPPRSITMGHIKASKSMKDVVTASQFLRKGKFKSNN